MSVTREPNAAAERHLPDFTLLKYYPAAVTTSNPHPARRFRRRPQPARVRVARLSKASGSRHPCSTIERRHDLLRQHKGTLCGPLVPVACKSRILGHEATPRTEPDAAFMADQTPRAASRASLPHSGLDYPCGISEVNIARAQVPAAKRELRLGRHCRHELGGLHLRIIQAPKTKMETRMARRTTDRRVWSRTHDVVCDS
jgi:hypothetical protein